MNAPPASPPKWTRKLLLWLLTLVNLAALLIGLEVATGQARQLAGSYPNFLFGWLEWLPPAWRYENWLETGRWVAILALWLFNTAEMTYHLRPLATCREGAEKDGTP